MNENGKREQEQPMTGRPSYGRLVLAFSILFAIVVLVVGFLGLTGVIDTAGLPQSWPSWCSQCQKAIIVTLCLGLAFFAGAFVFLAFKAKTDESSAAGDAVVLVCRILFYPVHMVVRVVVRFSALALLSLISVGTIILAYCLIASAPSWLTGTAETANAVLGASLIAVLAGVLPNWIVPRVRKAMENMDNIIKGVGDMSLFPVMAVQESWSGTMDAVRRIEKESVEFVFNSLFLVLFFLVAAVSYAALKSAVSPPESPPAVQEKASYIFLRNMPWFVSNVQSFFSSAVVFPRDATPEDLNGDGKDALSLNESDEQFYRAVYKPLLADLAKCGTPEKQVIIELSGFASSSKISPGNQQEKTIREKCHELNNRLKRLADSDKEPDINELFNLCVAEERSGFVEGMLKGFLEKTEQKNVFDFTVKRWDNLDQMQKQTKKIFCDVTSQRDNNTDHDDEKSCRDNGKYDATRGLMNRRVDVSIIDTPLCMM